MQPSQNNNNKRPRVDTTLVILIGLVVVAVAAALLKGGGGLAWQGTMQTYGLLKSIWIRLPVGFALGGFIQVLVPRAIIARWLGPNSGIKGIIIGSYTGIVLAGAPSSSSARSRPKRS